MLHNGHAYPTSSSTWFNVLRGYAGLYRISRLYSVPESQIIWPCYGGTVHSTLVAYDGHVVKSRNMRTVSQGRPGHGYKSTEGYESLKLIHYHYCTKCIEFLFL